MELSDAMEKSPAAPGIDPGTFRIVAQCLNHYATPGPDFLSTSTSTNSNKPLIITDFALNLAQSLLLVLAAEAYLVDGQL
jgi:hypothetical protein